MSGNWQPPAHDPFVALTDEAVHDAAVRARAERRERTERASEVATWTGTLRDLAERAVPAALRVRAGRVHRGAIVGLGTDHVVLRLATGGLVYLRVSAIRLVRPEPGRATPPAMGDREVGRDRRLADVLDEIVQDRGTAVVGIRDVADPLRGALLGLGDDVVTMRLFGDDRAVVYLPLETLDEIIVEP